MSLIGITVLLGLISTLSTILLTRLNFTPCFWYWLGWTLGISAAEYNDFAGWLPSITPLARDLILKTHIGAFLGFLISSIVIMLINKNASSNRPVNIYIPIQLSNNIIIVAIIIQFLVGVFLVGERIYQVGGVSGIRLLDIRDSYLENLEGFPRIATHVSMIFGFMPILFGLEDAFSGRIRWKRILFFWLSSVPGGLSTAGRGWIISTFISYGFSYILALDGPKGWRHIFRFSKKFIPVFLIAISLFVVVFIYRSEDYKLYISENDGNHWYEKNIFVMPVMLYFGVPVNSAGPYSEIASKMERSHGYLTFPWVFNQLRRIGFIDKDKYGQFITESRWEVRAFVDHRIASSHATIIPNLVGDYGEDGVFYAMMVLSAIFHFMGIYFRNVDLFGHAVSVMCASVGAFWLFQDSMFGTGGTLVGLMWTALFQYLYRRRDKIFRNVFLVNNT